MDKKINSIAYGNSASVMNPNEATDLHKSESITEGIIEKAMIKIKQEFEENDNTENQYINGDSSVSSTSNGTNHVYKSEYMVGNIISEDMIKEEQDLEKNALLEEEKLRKRILEDKKMEEENCFKRLKLLLSRSSIYAEFMAQKLKNYENKQYKRSKKQTEKNSQNSIENKEPTMADAKTGLKRRVNCSSTVPLKKQKSESRIINVYKKNVANMEFEDTKNDNPSKNEFGSLTDTDIMERQPKLLYGGLMRSYQLEGFEWLKSLYENGVNGILADEMGLGKTIQTIAFIAYLIEMEIPGPFFICAPLSTVPNWCAEFNRFAPDIPVLLYHGTKNQREELRWKIRQKEKVKNFSCYPVVITSYQIALIDTSHLSKISWKMLTIDEAHRIKNFACKLVSCLKRYNSEHRLLLTGTPLQNNLNELWSLLNFILPEIFDDLKVFQSWFDISKLTQNGAAEEIIAQEQEKQIISIIHQILAPFLLRRTKSDVELCLPPKKEVVVFAPLTTLQKEYYTAVLNNTIRKMFDTEVNFQPEALGKRKSKNTSFFGVKKNEVDGLLLNECTRNTVKSSCEAKEVLFDKNSCDLHLKLSYIFMCLRRICGHPYLISYPIDPKTEDYLIDEDLVTKSGKMLVLDSMLPELKKRGHKILIFTQFVSMLKILQDYCYYRNYKYNCLYGEMNLEERQKQLEEFKEESSFIFLISTKAGGLGLNLVTADTVIIYDSDWNPQGDLQAQDRCHRIGQTKPVVVYRLVVPNTCDERIVTFATAKRKLEKLIIQKGRFASKNKAQSSITKEEMLELLESSDTSGFVKTAENSVLSKEELEKLLDRSDMM